MIPSIFGPPTGNDTTPIHHEISVQFSTIPNRMISRSRQPVHNPQGTVGVLFDNNDGQTRHVDWPPCPWVLVSGSKQAMPESPTDKALLA
jgi:hypothetical protein